MKNLIDIQEQTIYAVEQAALFVQQEMGKIQQSDIETKSLNSLVTYVDKESEKILVKELQKIIPNASFLTEEYTVAPSQGEWQWIIDPLDGTTNFIHQIPSFGISVGLKHNEEIVVGVVKELNRNELFYATKNKGAFLNNKSINVTTTASLSDCLAATGFPYYEFDLMQEYMQTLAHLMTHTRGIRRLGAAAIDLCYVACGRFDAFFEYSLSPWDVAAGALIVQEAGGVVADFKGGDNWLAGRQIMASNKFVAAAMLELLREKFGLDK